MHLIPLHHVQPTLQRHKNRRVAAPRSLLQKQHHPVPRRLARFLDRIPRALRQKAASLDGLPPGLGD